MDCPKCSFALAHGAAECPRCGIVIAKFLRGQEAAAAPGEPPAPTPWTGVPPTPSYDATPDAARTERTARAVALPLALAAAWAAVKSAPGAVRMLSMWVHESGHAMTAWLCGYSAWPGPWFTPISMERSLPLTLLLVALLAAGAHKARQRRRWFWTVGAAATVVAVLVCTFALGAGKAQQLIVFGGDGGCLVLGTVLMLTVYAREEHPVRRDRLRWGLLVIGALAFMDVYVVWSGTIDQLPFGENENGLSDPSVLTEMYGWSVLTLTRRYVGLARICLGVLTLTYLGGLVSRSDQAGGSR